jgi:SHAQKYF class myb-like DNA-binding protein
MLTVCFGFLSFYLALQKVGKQWTLMPDFIPTRTQSQIRSHAQKYFAKLEAQFESKDILGD